MQAVRSSRVLSIESGFGVYCRTCASIMALLSAGAGLLLWMQGELREPGNIAVAFFVGSALCIAISIFAEQVHRPGFAERVLLLDDALLVDKNRRRQRIALRDVVEAFDDRVMASKTEVEYVRVRYRNHSGAVLSLDFLPRPELRREEIGRSEACAVIMRAAERVKRAPPP